MYGTIASHLIKSSKTLFCCGHGVPIGSWIYWKRIVRNTLLRKWESTLQIALIGLNSTNIMKRENIWLYLNIPKEAVGRQLCFSKTPNVEKPHWARYRRDRCRTGGITKRNAHQFKNNEIKYCFSNWKTTTRPATSFVWWYEPVLYIRPTK